MIGFLDSSILIVFFIFVGNVVKPVHPGIVDHRHLSAGVIGVHVVMELPAVQICPVGYFVTKDLGQLDLLSGGKLQGKVVIGNAKLH